MAPAMDRASQGWTTAIGSGASAVQASISVSNLACVASLLSVIAAPELAACG
jgi:hypothetical protein